MWQGKAMLVSVVLPLVLLTGARLVRSGTTRTHLLFGAALVAAVGVSNSAVFLVPVLVGGIGLAALALRRPRGALRLAAWLVYPLAAGAVSVLLAPAAPSAAQRLAEGFDVSSGATRVADPLLTVPGRHGILVVTVPRDRARRTRHPERRAPHGDGRRPRRGRRHPVARPA